MFEDYFAKWEDPKAKPKKRGPILREDPKAMEVPYRVIAQRRNRVAG